MKKVLILSLLSLALSGWAYDFKVNGIYYNYNASNQTAIVTYDGAGSNGDNSDPNRYTGKVVIPSTVTYNGRTLTVASLSRDAFYNCKQLTEVVMPNTIQEIGNDCFYDCTSLAKADLPESIETIREGAFSNTIITSVILPEKLKYLAQQAFYNCNSLTTVTIKCTPNNTTYSGLKGIFYKCSNIKEIIIESNVDVIRSSSWWEFGDNVRTVICKNQTPPSFSGGTAFSNIVYLEAILYVPIGCKNKYSSANVWNNFFNIQEKDFGDDTGNKCAAPSISYNNGRLLFTSSTEGATCVTTIIDSDIATHTGNELQLSVTYNLSVYAKATGKENSDVVTATLCWIDQQPQTEGISNSIASISATPVLIQSSGGMLTISGVEDGTKIGVYNISGRMVANANASGSTTIATNLQAGDIAIIRIGEKSIKVLMK